MPKIKFSHDYLKFPLTIRNGETKLLEVFKTTYKELSGSFVIYDTQISHRQEFYKLPKTDLLVLLLITEGCTQNHLWTTIRRWTPEKERYYKNLRGQVVDIEIKEIEGTP